MTESGTPWKDLAEQARVTEEPYSLVEIDVDRWDGFSVVRRLGKVTNALVQAHERMAELRKAAHDLGVRSGDVYRKLQGEKILLEEQIESLEDKKDYLKELSFTKRQEQKHTS
jgi:hypothetical protein